MPEWAWLGVIHTRRLEHPGGVGQQVRGQPQRELAAIVGHTDAVCCGVVGRGWKRRPGREGTVPAQDSLDEHVHVEDDRDLTHAA